MRRPPGGEVSRIPTKRWSRDLVRRAGPFFPPVYSRLQPTATTPGHRLQLLLTLGLLFTLPAVPLAAQPLLANLTIEKATNPPMITAPFSFELVGPFEVGPLATSPFFLAAGEATSFDLAPGTYAVGEQLSSGFVLGQVECSTLFSGPTASGSVQLQLGAGEVVTCTFTNQFGSVPPPGPGNPTEVPGLGPWGVLCLIAALSAAGLVGLRR